MNKDILNWITVIVISAGNLCWGQGCADVTAAKPVIAKEQKPIDDVLAKLNVSAEKLKSYQCRVEYLFRQPLFDSQTLRTGRMFSLRDGKDSLLRIDFETIKQDDEPQEKYVEQYIFDGIWLTRIDYQLKQVKMHQLIDPNDLVPGQSTDAFDLITEHLPIVGFTKTDRLKKEFDIELAEPEEGDANDLIKLHMKVKPGSIYAEDYTAIDFAIDEKFYLPVSVTAYSVEEDIYQFKFVEPKVNEKLDRKIFELKIPKDFPKPEVNALKKKDSPQSTQRPQSKESKK